MKKNIYFMIFPVIIAVLMIIIFIFDKRTKHVQESESSTAAETLVSTTASVTMVMKLADFDTYGLQEDAVVEVKNIIADYQNAKLHANSAKMLELYGKTVEDENLSAALENDRRLYQRFDETKTYITNGVMDDSYLVFVTSKIKFHFVETLAPSLMWAYVQKQSDGTWILKDPYNLTTEETAFVNKVASTDAVKTMSAQVKKELAAAVISDAQLANVYRTLSNSNVTSQELISESSGQTEQTKTESDAQISIILESSSTEASDSKESTEHSSISESDVSASDSEEGTAESFESEETNGNGESAAESSAQ